MRKLYEEGQNSKTEETSELIEKENLESNVLKSSGDINVLKLDTIQESEHINN